MRYSKNIKGILLAIILITGSLSQLRAQDFTSVSFADLTPGSLVKGTYLLELGENSGNYLKEQSNGSITTSSLDADDESFYFWVIENSNDRSFQLHSATTQSSVVMINEDGTAKLTGDFSKKASKLMFRMDGQGPLRYSAVETTVAIGSLITQELDSYSGTADCKCYGLSFEDVDRIVFHQSDFSQEDYTDFPFTKTNISSGGSVTQSGNSTSLALDSDSESQSFVSSLFFVNGFGINDFQLTAASGTEATVGLLDYTQHHYTPEVYELAMPKIGLKITNNKISIVYLSGDQELPSTTNVIDRDIETNFQPDSPIHFGFEDQNTFAAIQNGDTVRMQSSMPAELFLNQSLTQTARMLVNLDAGQVDVSYMKANGLINSQNDHGTDEGLGFISTDAYLPYNKGNSFMNRFDWQKSKWPVRYTDGAGDVENEVFSPFYSSDIEMSSISAQFDESGFNYLGGEDFSNTEGWELLKANLGYNANGTLRNEAPQYPYIIFYDRVGATLRTFIYAKNEGEANQLTVSLGVVGGIPGNTGSTDYTPLLWGSLQQFSTLDDTESGNYSKSIPFYSTAGRKWYFYDFIMEYDPCSEFFESSIEVQVFKTTKGTLSMVGRLEGGSVPAGTEAYDSWTDNKEDFLMGVMDTDYGSLENTLGDISFNQYEKYDLMDFQDEITGTLVGANIPEWQKEQARLEWETQALAAKTEEEGIKAAAEGQLQDGIVGVIGGAIGAKDNPVASGVFEAVAGVANIIQASATLATDRSPSPSQKLANQKKIHYQNIKEKGKYDDQEINLKVPAPRPHVVFGELALKGTLTIDTELMLDYISTPGGLNSDKAPEWRLNGSRGAAPLYNKPMGKFTMLNQPDFGIAIAYDSDRDLYRAYLKTKQKPYFAINQNILGKITDAFTLSINVQTSLGVNGSKNKASKGYSNMFDFEDVAALPGEMDISDLIDWIEIDKNIDRMKANGHTNIADSIEHWITVSYDVWSLTLTNLEARNLENVAASSNQYFDGSASFVIEEVAGRNTSFGLAMKAEELANSSFSDYDFGDHDVFGNNYQISNTQDNFAAVMYDFCTILNNNNAPDTTSGVVSSRREIEHAELHDGLNVYPNPTNGVVNFELSTELEGNTMIILYDHLGQSLIQTNTESKGFESIKGRLNMSTLPSGVYILQMILPDGEAISKQIIRE